jgi:hypothetical protein
MFCDLLDKQTIITSETNFSLVEPANHQISHPVDSDKVKKDYSPSHVSKGKFQSFPQD